eukprot:732237-Pleurochrysis_carterae.AAC.1
MDALMRARDESIAALASANASKLSADPSGEASQYRTTGPRTNNLTHPERAPDVDIKRVRAERDDANAPRNKSA